MLMAVGSGCANIIPPSGGPRDSIPPRLISATPPDSEKNVKPSKITLTFDEYIAQLQNAENIIISPTLPSIPNIESHLKNVTVKFRDTLESNTTYSINFGNSIRDVNEGNIFEGFTFVFSTGNRIDENTLSGKVILAETGKIDSSLIVVLHNNLADSAIIKQRPRYYTRVDGSGNFKFNNLPAGKFAVYAVSKESYSRQYDSTMLFAFLDSAITVSQNTPPVTLYAYTQEKRKTIVPPPASGNKGQDKRLRYTNPEGVSKDAFTPLVLEFTKKIKTFDSSRITLTDTGFNHLSGYSVKTDSTAAKLVVEYPWKLNTRYRLLISKDAVTDVDGTTLSKNDTLSFTTKRAEDYGEVRVRFNNLDLSKNPVLQIVQNETIVESVPLTTREWKKSLFKPGEYDLRILYDTNKNGTWDPGNFSRKKQPELVQSIPKKLSVRANWENEVDITL
jgi:hypothetical protein